MGAIFCRYWCIAVAGSVVVTIVLAPPAFETTETVLEASREQLAIQLFESIPGAEGDDEQFKQLVLTLWQITRLESKRSSSNRHKAIGSSSPLVTPIYDPQHLLAHNTEDPHSADTFVVEIARVYQAYTVSVGPRSNLVTDSLAQAISLAKDMMSSRAWPLSANGFRILTRDGDELYRFSD